MFRVAHISDLHIRAESANNDASGFIDAATSAFLAGLGIQVHAGGHDDVKLKALEVHLRTLAPSVIAITGDVTNFGDRPSFDLATDFIKRLGALPGNPKILCVPGNHDALAERAVMARAHGGFWQRQLLRVVKRLSPEVRTAERAGDRDFFLHSWEPQAHVELLGNYAEFCRKNGLAACSPSVPIDIDLPWGTVSFFLFNSVNGPGLMANKGLIGASQMQQLVGALNRPSRTSRDDVVRIALLHHHPVSAPLSGDDATNRLYDWMEDGPLFLDLLNRHGFHFVLHGHQHEPFVCSIEYGLSETKKTLIVASGSATQAGGGSKPFNSFNVVDFISPFQARVSRHDYAIGGFERDAKSRVVALVPIESVNLGNADGPVTVENWALQSLISNSFRDLDTLGSAFHYEELHFEVEITPNQLYKASYRRIGTVKTSGGTEGPVFVITGSPAMHRHEMELNALQYLSDGTRDELGPVIALKDEPNLKILQVQMRDMLAVGSRFDIELRFQWQASLKEPNSFDAISLIGFEHPVKKVRYRVRVPWRASQVALHSVGAGIKHVADVQPRHERLEDGHWRYSFELENPAPVAYVFRFPQE